MFPCEYCKISSNNGFEEHLHTATSENNKNIFLGKTTNHNDHCMINVNYWLRKNKTEYVEYEI